MSGAIHWPAFPGQLAVWLPVCVISAVPSFLWATQIHHRTEQMAATVVGVWIFALAYALAASTHAAHRWRDNDPALRRTFWIGYGTRVALGGVFPIGMMVDGWIGTLSVSITHWAPIGAAASSHDDGFLHVLVTTLVHGTLLNIVLRLCMMLMYGLVRESMRDTAPISPLCQQCGYDLRASRDACPECGHCIRIAGSLPSPKIAGAVDHGWKH